MHLRASVFSAQILENFVISFCMFFWHSEHCWRYKWCWREKKSHTTDLFHWINLPFKIHWTIHLRSLVVSKPRIGLIISPLFLNFYVDARRWSYKLKSIEKFQNYSYLKIEDFLFLTWQHLRKKPICIEKAKMKKIKKIRF